MPGVRCLSKRIPDHRCPIDRIDISERHQPAWIPVMTHQKQSVAPVSNGDSDERGINLAIAPIGRQPAIDLGTRQPSGHEREVLGRQLLDARHAHHPVRQGLAETLELVPQGGGPSRGGRNRTG